jgi:hypothetical protein
MAVDPNATKWEQQAATGTGIPFAVTHQQALAESGETDTPVSSAGAHGFWQFLASTYNTHAAQAGVPQGSWNNPADETKVYIVYMNELLKQEGGSIFKALEAYNAGPGNLGAGAGYAAGIMAKAGVPQSASAGTAGGVQPSAADLGIPNPLNPLGGVAGGIVNGLVSGILKAFGVPSFKDMFQRLGLILFGAVLVIVGIRILSNNSSKGGGGDGGGGQGKQREEESDSAKTGKLKEEQPSTEALSSDGGESAGVEGVGASEALEAAAVALWHST